MVSQREEATARQRARQIQRFWDEHLKKGPFTNAVKITDEDRRLANVIEPDWKVKKDKSEVDYITDWRTNARSLASMLSTFRKTSARMEAESLGVEKLTDDEQDETDAEMAAEKAMEVIEVSINDAVVNPVEITLIVDFADLGQSEVVARPAESQSVRFATTKSTHEDTPQPLRTIATRKLKKRVVNPTITQDEDSFVDLQVPGSFPQADELNRLAHQIQAILTSRHPDSSNKTPSTTPAEMKPPLAHESRQTAATLTSEVRTTQGHLPRSHSHEVRPRHATLPIRQVEYESISQHRDMNPTANVGFVPEQVQPARSRRLPDLTTPPPITTSTSIPVHPQSFYQASRRDRTDIDPILTEENIQRYFEMKRRGNGKDRA
ncbi:hypothetical protein G7046_g6902 [Stylonectria norvegica]|nr:hypothetical protein G7046_g6902 [Stylonectria norvegica]